MELRKYVDVARAAPASTLFLVDGSAEHEIECLEQTGFPFFGQFIRDCLARTEVAMRQDHAFMAAELSMQAQAIAEGAKA